MKRINGGPLRSGINNVLKNLWPNREATLDELTKIEALGKTDPGINLFDTPSRNAQYKEKHTHTVKFRQSYFSFPVIGEEAPWPGALINAESVGKDAIQYIDATEFRTEQELILQIADGTKPKAKLTKMERESVNQLRDELLPLSMPGEYTAKAIYRLEPVYSTEDFKAKAPILSKKISAQFSSKKSQVLMRIELPYFTFTQPGIKFAHPDTLFLLTAPVDAVVELVAGKTAMIRSVTYGRALYVLWAANCSMEELMYSLMMFTQGRENEAFQFIAGKPKVKDVLNNATLKVWSVTGATGLEGGSSSSQTELRTKINQLAKFSPTELGTPISYDATNLDNQQNVPLNSVADYSYETEVIDSRCEAHDFLVHNIRIESNGQPSNGWVISNKSQLTVSVQVRTSGNSMDLYGQSEPQNIGQIATLRPARQNIYKPLTVKDFSWLDYNKIDVQLTGSITAVNPKTGEEHVEDVDWLVRSSYTHKPQNDKLPRSHTWSPQVDYGVKFGFFRSKKLEHRIYVDVDAYRNNVRQHLYNKPLHEKY